MQFELWRDLIESDRKAMARFILITGFSPDFLAGMDDAAIGSAVENMTATTDWNGMARQVALDLSADVADQARRVTKPALVIGCTHDHMVPPAHARMLASLIPGARYAEMATGHLAPVERPEELAGRVIDFLSGASAASSASSPPARAPRPSPWT